MSKKQPIEMVSRFRCIFTRKKKCFEIFGRKGEIYISGIKNFGRGIDLVWALDEYVRNEKELPNLKDREVGLVSPYRQGKKKGAQSSVA